MAYSRRKKTVDVAEATTEEEVVIANPCNAWCFILGPALGAFCQLTTEHEGEHMVRIDIFTEPKAHFTVSWALDS